ncbi:hypothetical protein, partial [Aeromonas sobria]|uniref:hypothetical protein n=1 Tax=Aeromonas sobria TaxID=646 RepID=UPI00165249E2
IRGFLGQWEPVNQMAFSGNYMYELTTPVAAGQLGETKLKIADASWNIANYGSCAPADVLTPSTPLTLCKSGGDIGMTLSKAGNYKFVFTAMNKEKPTLSVSVADATP